MPERISVAAKAIEARVDELSRDHFGTPEEREAIQSALTGLEALRAEWL